MSPVGSVGAPGIWGERMAEKLLGARNRVVQGEFPALGGGKLLRIVKHGRYCSRNFWVAIPFPYR